MLLCVCAESGKLLDPSPFQYGQLKDVTGMFNSVSLEDVQKDGRFVYCEDSSSDDWESEHGDDVWVCMDNPSKTRKIRNRIVSFASKMRKKKSSSDIVDGQDENKQLVPKQRYRILQILGGCKIGKPVGALCLSDNGIRTVLLPSQKSGVTESVLDSYVDIGQADLHEESDFVVVDAIDSIPDSSDGFSLNMCYQNVRKRKLIGQGGFGMVYEGELNGKPIAIKEVGAHHYKCEQGRVFIESLLSELKVLQVIRYQTFNHHSEADQVTSFCVQFQKLKTCFALQAFGCMLRLALVCCFIYLIADW